MSRNLLVVFTVFSLVGCAHLKTSTSELNVEKLTPVHIAEGKALVSKLEPFIQTKDREGKLPSLTFKELESPLNAREKKFLRSFRDLKAEEVGVKIPFRGFSQGEKDLVRVNGQKIRIKGEEKELPPQFLSPQIYQAYQFMMRAMERSIGKRLFVESGYRSSAHQLYLFIFYLSNHDYSIRETVKWVALPGYSEHGDPQHLAIDFINAEGVNGEYDVAAFEMLPENQWLLKNAGRFGFVLSYPKNVPVGITYEPWHWRYAGLTPAILNPVRDWKESSTPRVRLPFREQSSFVSSALKTHQRADPRSSVRLLSADRNLQRTVPGTDGSLFMLSGERTPSSKA